MKRTENLNLPIYDNPESDIFKINDINNAHKAIDKQYKELKNIKETVESTNPSANLQGQINDINASLDTKANKNEVVKKGAVDLDEMTERTLQAIQGGGGASFELLSIPRDSSVDLNKLNEDFQSVLFPRKSIKYPIDNLDETLPNHINANSRFIQKEIIPKNSYLSYVDVYLGNDGSFVGGTLKLELFSIDGSTITKYYEKSFITKIGVNKLDVNKMITKNTYIAFSRNGFSLLKYKQGTENNCYYTSDINTSSFDLASLNLGNFILSMKVEVLDLGIRTFKLETSNVLLVDKENGDFTNVQDAINSINDDSEIKPYTIMVGQGVFPRFSMRSSVTGIDRMRYISIIGTNKYSSIIRDNTGHYVTGSCDIWNKGTIENLTVEVSHKNDTSEERRKAYALHFDFGQCDAEVRNCILISHQAPAVGIGLYQDTTIKFKDCELYNLCPSDYGTMVDYGAIFCHSQSAENITNQNIKLENCKVVSQNGDKSAWFSKIGTGGEMIVESINTMYYSHKEGIGAKVINNAKLSPYSYGNNASNMNN